MARRQGRILWRYRIARLICGRRLDWAKHLFDRDVVYVPISKWLYERELRAGVRFDGWIKAEDLGDGRVELIFTKVTDRDAAEATNG